MKLIKKLVLNKEQLDLLKNNEIKIDDLVVKKNGSPFSFSLKEILSNDEILKYKKQIMDSKNFQIDLIKNHKDIFTENEINYIIKKILKDPSNSSKYANDIIKGRWIEGEKTIIKDPMVSVRYAYEILKGRWEEAEPIIASHPYSAVNYSMNLNKRWVDFTGINLKFAQSVEESFSKKAHFAAPYAIEVLKKRWIDVEDIPKNIAKQAEESIATDIDEVDWILGYAEEFIGRWKEAEPTIAASEYSLEYVEKILKKPWSSLEDIDKNVIERAEKSIFVENSYGFSDTKKYVFNYLKSFYPPAEYVLALNKETSSLYVKNFLNDKISFDFINKNINDSDKKNIINDSKKANNSKRFLTRSELEELTINNSSIKKSLNIFSKNDLEKMIEKIKNNDDEFSIIIRNNDKYELITGALNAIARNSIDLPVKALILNDIQEKSDEEFEDD